jgi:hypothetical protein
MPNFSRGAADAHRPRAGWSGQCLSSSFRSNSRPQGPGRGLAWPVPPAERVAAGGGIGGCGRWFIVRERAGLGYISAAGPPVEAVVGELQGELVFHAQLLARERVFGPEHPNTVTVRTNLATWTTQASQLT